MKHLIMAIALLSGSLAAQSSPGAARPVGASPAFVPSYSIQNCAGFISRKPVARLGTVVGSKESPHEGQFAAHSQMFLQGKPLEEGKRYRLVRQVVDPNIEESSPEQRKRLQRLGAMYQEIGWATVNRILDGTAVASFDFACDTAIVGDLVVAYEEREPIAVRTYDPPMESFKAKDHAVKGAILGSKDFDELLGTGQIIYTNFGTVKGARRGDYLLILRGYAPENLNAIDRISERLPAGGDPARVNPGAVKADADRRMPQHVMGEALVLYANADSSTALITRAVADLELGDVVESEKEAAGAENEPVAASADEPACHPMSRWQRLRHFKLHNCEPAPSEEPAAQPVTSSPAVSQSEHHTL